MRESDKEEFGELAGVARRLRGADLSGESRVKEALKARLLAKAARRERRVPAFAWLLPAAAAAALFVMFGPWRDVPAPQARVLASSYALPDDGYGACGRRGLGDFQAAERF